MRFEYLFTAMQAFLLVFMYMHCCSLCILHRVGVHRIPHFRIQLDPDPTGSITVGSGRIRIFTGSGSGCNLIRIKAELQPMTISKHRIIKDKTSVTAYYS